MATPVLSASHFGQTRRHTVVILTAERAFRARADADALPMLLDARFGISRRRNAMNLTAEHTFRARVSADASPMLRTSGFGGARRSPFFLAGAAIRANRPMPNKALVPTAGVFPAVHTFSDSNPFSRIHAFRPPAVGTAYSFARQNALHTIEAAADSPHMLSAVDPSQLSSLSFSPSPLLCRCSAPHTSAILADIPL